MKFKLEVLLYSLFVSLLSMTDIFYVHNSARDPLLNFLINLFFAGLIIFLTGLVVIDEEEFIHRNYLFSSALLILVIFEFGSVTSWNVTLIETIFLIIPVLFLLFIIINISYAKKKHKVTILKYIFWIIFPILYWVSYVIIRTFFEIMRG